MCVYYAWLFTRKRDLHHIHAPTRARQYVCCLEQGINKRFI